MKINDLIKYKNCGRKISMITCYDYSMAKIVAQTDIDSILIGDSVAMIMHGYDSTIHATMEMMELHTKAVKKGAPNKFIISDLPFLSYQTSPSDALINAGRLLRAGADAVKLEGSKGLFPTIQKLIESGIPVVGHLGYTPQSSALFGNNIVQGRNSSGAQIKEDAIKLSQSGICALVLECIPELLATEITNSIAIPTIGIGAGKHTSGQVLVLQDMLGFNKEFNPRFLRKYLDGESTIIDAINQYHDDVVRQEFPMQQESYQ